MSTQPDMIRDFARMLRVELEREGRGPWEIRAEVLVSLNAERAPLEADDRPPGQPRRGPLPSRPESLDPPGGGREALGFWLETR